MYWKRIAHIEIVCFATLKYSCVTFTFRQSYQISSGYDQCWEGIGLFDIRGGPDKIQFFTFDTHR